MEDVDLGFEGGGGRERNSKDLGWRIPTLSIGR